MERNGNIKSNSLPSCSKQHLLAMIGEEFPSVYKWQTEDQMIKVLAAKVHHNHIGKVYA